MGSEWKEKIISEVVTLIGGGTPKRSVPEYWNGSVPWLSVKDFNNGYRHVGYAEESITELGVRKSSTRILQTGQLIISARGTVGALAQLALPMAFNQSCYGIDAKPEYTINDFLYYMIKHSISNIKKLTHGAVFDTITKNTFDYIKIQLPPLPEQKAIAHILGSLDNKIELNRKMNSTLESMAQALFKSWFIDFDPVIDKALAAGNPIPEPLQKRAEIRRQLGDKQKSLPTDIEQHFPNSFIFCEELGWIPEGWAITPFSQLAYLDTSSIKPFNKPDTLWEHYSIPAYDKGCSPSYEMGSEIKSSKYKVSETAILCSKLNPITPRKWLPNPRDLNTAICSTEFMQFIPYDSLERSFLYELIMSKPFNSGILQRVTGSTGSRQRAQPKSVAQMEVIEPPKSLRLIYSQFASKHHRLINEHINENNTLSSLRDTLLPKLISGDLRVPDAEKLVEKVL